MKLFESDKMWRLRTHLILLYIYNTIVPGYSNVEFNQIFFGCLGDDETLEMMCRVNDLQLGVYIFHKNKELAYCVAFPFNSCHNTNGNISMLSTSAVVYIIDSRQLNILNGSWTCRNGAGPKNENSSLEIFSTKCRSSSLPSPGRTAKDKTELGIVLLLLPLVVFCITIIIMDCCIFSGQNDQNDPDEKTQYLSETVHCLWQCKKMEQICSERRKIGWKFLKCFILFGVYCTAVVVYYDFEISTDVRIVLLIIFIFIGISVSILIPVIWKSREGNIRNIFGRDGGSQPAVTGSGKAETDSIKEKMPLLKTENTVDNTDNASGEPELMETRQGKQEASDVSNETIPMELSTVTAVDAGDDRRQGRTRAGILDLTEPVSQDAQIIKADVHGDGDNNKYSTTHV